MCLGDFTTVVLEQKSLKGMSLSMVLLNKHWTKPILFYVKIQLEDPVMIV